MRRYLLAEFCAGPFYMGWWLYERDHNDGRRNDGRGDWGWIRDSGPFSRQADVGELLAPMGRAPPAPSEHSQALAEWFAATFPAGLLVDVQEYGGRRRYELIEIVARLPKQRRRGVIRTLRGAAGARRRSRSTPGRPTAAVPPGGSAAARGGRSRSA